MALTESDTHLEFIQLTWHSPGFTALYWGASRLITGGSSLFSTQHLLGSCHLLAWLLASFLIKMIPSCTFHSNHVALNFRFYVVLSHASGCRNTTVASLFLLQWSYLAVNYWICVLLRWKGLYRIKAEFLPSGWCAACVFLILILCI